MKAGVVVLIGLLALSGCKGGPKQDAGAGTAQGEVLPGAASDAMLPLDTVQSQAPLAPKAEGGDAPSDKPGKSSVKTKQATPQPAAEAVPAAEVKPARAVPPAAAQ